MENLDRTDKRRNLLRPCSQGLLSKEQKEYCRERKGANDLKYIYLHFLKEAKTKRENVAMTWIDSKKLSYMDPQT